MTEQETGVKVFSIKSPQKLAWNPEMAHQLMVRMYALSSVAFMIQATPDDINWRFQCYAKDAERVSSIFSTLFPSVQIDLVPGEDALCSWYYWVDGILPYIYPLRGVMDMKRIDPLAGLVKAISKLKSGERCLYIADFKWVSDQKIFDLGREMLDSFNPTYRMGNNKFSATLKHASIQIGITAATKGRANYIADSIFQALAPFNLEGGNKLVRPGEKTHFLVLTAEEMAAFWHLPNEQYTEPIISWTDLLIPAPLRLAENKEGVLLGDNTIAGKSVPIYLYPGDRFTHMNIVGKTGVGKSTLMHNLIHQDIAAGKGVGVVDPHGRLITDILRTSIPDDRIDDVVLIDIADEAHPPPLNPLSAPDGDTARAGGQVIAILDKVGERGLTPLMVDTLTAAFTTLKNETTPTPIDVSKLFSDLNFRYKLLNKLDDFISLQFWNEFEGKSPSEQQKQTSTILYRIRQLYRNEILRFMTCRPESFNFAKLMSQKKIILMSLGVDELLVPATEKQILGATLVSQLQMHHLLAARQQSSGKLPFYLYIDEVQNFVTSSLNFIFEEARKFGLSLTVGNQYLGQLTGKTLDSIMGTVGATVAFQVGLSDAKVLAPYYRPEFDVDDLVNLDIFKTAVKIRYRGETLPGFSIANRPPPADTNTPEAIEREQQIRQRSRELYTPTTKEEIRAWLDKRYPRPKFGQTTSSSPEPGGDDDWRT